MRTIITWDLTNFTSVFFEGTCYKRDLSEFIKEKYSKLKTCLRECDGNLGQPNTEIMTYYATQIYYSDHVNVQHNHLTFL